MLAYIRLHICWTEVLSDNSCSYHVGTQTYQSDHLCAVYFVLTGSYFYDASSFCLLSHPVDLLACIVFPDHMIVSQRTVSFKMSSYVVHWCAYVCIIINEITKGKFHGEHPRCFTRTLYYFLFLWIVHLLFPTELFWNAFYLFIYFRILSDRTLKKVCLWYAKTYA